MRLMNTWMSASEDERLVKSNEEQHTQLKGKNKQAEAHEAKILLLIKAHCQPDERLFNECIW